MRFVRMGLEVVLAHKRTKKGVFSIVPMGFVVVVPVV